MTFERLTLALVVAAALGPHEPQNLLEHLPWDGDLGHLEGDTAAVAHDLRADMERGQMIRIASSS
jgi:hypothetical protein